MVLWVMDLLATTSMSAKHLMLVVITHHVQMFQALLNVHVMTDIRVMDSHVLILMSVLLKLIIVMLTLNVAMFQVHLNVHVEPVL
jgi:hypothetical protein